MYTDRQTHTHTHTHTQKDRGNGGNIYLSPIKVARLGSETHCGNPHRSTGIGDTLWESPQIDRDRRHTVGIPTDRPGSETHCGNPHRSNVNQCQNCGMEAPFHVHWLILMTRVVCCHTESTMYVTGSQHGLSPTLLLKLKRRG